MKIIKTAVWNGKYFDHFGIHECTCSIYGNKPEEIIEVEVETAEDQTLPKSNSGSVEVDYWGWNETGSDDITMIYAQRFLVNMCFPYGIKSSENAGQGKAYRLNVKLLNK